MRDSKHKSASSFEITIEKLVYGGAGLGRHEGKVVFVPFAAAGDRLVVRPTEQKKNLIRASIERILEPGPARVESFCEHFGVCGGCQWQHIDYLAQVEAKRSILEELFHHRFPETSQLVIEMKPSPEARGYRSRARVQSRGDSSSRATGFFAFQSHDVVDVARCPLFRPSLNKGLTEFRELIEHGNVDPGVREAEVVCSEEEGAWTWAEIERAPGAVGPAPDHFANSEGNSRAVSRKIGEFEYLVTPGVFFQANDYMVTELLSTVQELVCVRGASSALDLFAGVGLFTLPIASAYNSVTAVESSSEATRLCEANANRCGLSNVRAVCAEVTKWIKAVNSVAAPKFDLVLLDPPRTGAGAEIMQGIAEWGPETILYVSCDPQTLARDLAFPAMKSYRIDYVKGLDLFPQTYHFETVVRLKRR